MYVRGHKDVPVYALREDSLESFCACALDHIDECPGVEEDLKQQNMSLVRWPEVTGAYHGDVGQHGSTRR